MSAIWSFFTRGRNAQPQALATANTDVATVVATASETEVTQSGTPAADSTPDTTGVIPSVVNDFELVAPPSAGDDRPIDHTDVTTKSKAETKAELPTSPTSTSMFAPDPLDTKAKRAHEVARQRAKHAGDRRKTRIGKIPKFARGRRGEDEDGAVDVDEDVTVPVMKSAKPTAKGAKNAKNVKAAAVEREEIPHLDSLKLEDVLREAKVRKEKVGDFEVIPSLRTVIALDKFDFEAKNTRELAPVVISSGSSDDDSDSTRGSTRKGSKKLNRSYAQAVQATA